MNLDLAERIAALCERAMRPGLRPSDRFSVADRLSTLEASAGERHTILALALDGHRAAAEDEWPPGTDDALKRPGWPDHWNSRSRNPLRHPVTSAEARVFVSAVTSAAFQQAVVDRVGAGDLPPLDGDELRLADDVRQAGWGNHMLDGDGSNDVVQSKATDCTNDLAEHRPRHSDDVELIMTSGAAETAADSGMAVIDSGIRNADLGVLDAAGSLDQASALHVLVPLDGLAAVTTRAVLAVRQGASTDEIASLLKEKVLPLVAVHAAALAWECTTGTPGLRPVTVAAIRLGRHRRAVHRRSTEHLTNQRHALAELLEMARRLSA